MSTTSNTSASTSPWAATLRPPTKSLADIMSEELANEVINGDDNEVDYVYNEEDFMTADEIAAKRLAEELSLSSMNTESITPEDFMTEQEKADRDLALALAAQDEEDFRRMKKDPKYGNSKVNVCYSLDEHYMYGSESGVVNKSQQESSDNYAAKELGARILGQDGSDGVYFKNGVANIDGITISKHDALLDGLMNSQSLEEMDGSGDMCGLLVSNSVSNKLKSFSQKQKQKGVYVGGGRVSAKDSRSTSEAVLDESTRLLLFKLIQKNIFDELHGVIKTGKEANVYHATKKNSCDSLSNPRTDCFEKESFDQEDHQSVAEGSVASTQSHYTFKNCDFEYCDVAVKVFKTTLNEFGNRIDYIKGDHRFSREKYAKNSNNKRKFIAQWVEKEFRNLCRARSKGLNVPRPLLFKDNVLLTEMITESTMDNNENKCGFTNSPQLREVDELPAGQWENYYEQTLLILKELYRKCKLVHGDLSEYNLLLQNKEHVYALDFGQAMDTSHPEHRTYLMRDINTVNSFFKKKGVSVKDSNEIFGDIISNDESPSPDV
jgi:serine/threonine-protein kinase RIO1